jgi:hypothetical protein
LDLQENVEIAAMFFDCHVGHVFAPEMKVGAASAPRNRHHEVKNLKGCVFAAPTP